jgi:hypothetical protein
VAANATSGRVAEYWFLWFIFTSHHTHYEDQLPSKPIANPDEINKGKMKKINGDR